MKEEKFILLSDPKDTTQYFLLKADEIVLQVGKIRFKMPEDFNLDFVDALIFETKDKRYIYMKKDEIEEELHQK